MPAQESVIDRKLDVLQHLSRQRHSGEISCEEFERQSLLALGRSLPTHLQPSRHPAARLWRALRTRLSNVA